MSNVPGASEGQQQSNHNAGAEASSGGKSARAAGRIRLALMCLTAGIAAYILGDYVQEARSATGEPKPLESADVALTVCPRFDSAKISDQLVARTSFGTREAAAQFIQQRSEGFDHLRKRLFTPLLQGLGSVKTCFEGQTTGSVVAELSLRVRSQPAEARAWDVRVERIVGRSELHPLLRRCLADQSAKLDLRVAALPGERFIEYDDIYPNYLPLALGREGPSLFKLLATAPR